MQEIRPLINDLETLSDPERRWSVGRELIHLGMALLASAQMAPAPMLSKIMCTAPDPNDPDKLCGEDVDILVDKRGAKFECPKCGNGIQIV